MGNCSTSISTRALLSVRNVAEIADGFLDHMIRALSSLILLAVITSCAARHTGMASPPTCGAVEPDSPEEPLYAEARDLLTNPAWSDLRRENGIGGTVADVRWLSDDELCARITSALHNRVGDPPIPAVWAGSHILVHPRLKTSNRYVFDRRGELVAILGTD